MSNSTHQYWDVDGTSLQTYAWNIVSWGGNRESPPPLRGDNVTVPFRDGQLWQPKRLDARVITLGMWVIGADADGAVSDGSIETFRANWRSLRGLLWQPQRQFVLTRRWFDGEAIRSASALAQYAGGLEPGMRGPASAAFTVDLMLADPLFYATDVTVDGLTVGTHDVTGVFTGDVASPRHTVRFDGPLSEPSIVVKRGSEVLSTCTYNGDLIVGEFVEVEWPSFEWTSAGLGVTPAKLSHRKPYCVVLDPTATSLVVGGTGAGTVTVSFEAAWL